MNCDQAHRDHRWVLIEEKEIVVRRQQDGDETLTTYGMRRRYYCSKCRALATDDKEGDTLITRGVTFS